MNCKNNGCIWNFNEQCCPEDEKGFLNATPDKDDCPTFLRKDHESQLRKVYMECLSYLPRRSLKELTAIRDFIVAQREDQPCSDSSEENKEK